MAEPLTPAGVKVQGHIKTIFVPGGLDRAAPSVAAATGVGALEITNIMYANTGRYQAQSTTGEAPRRHGSRKSWQQFGTTNESFSDSLRYTVDPQGAAGSDGKKAWEALPEGTAGSLLQLPGKDVDEDIAAADFGIVIPVKMGARYIDGDPTNEFDEFSVVQGIIVVAPGAGDLVALVA